MVRVASSEVLKVKPACRLPPEKEPKVAAHSNSATAHWFLWGTSVAFFALRTTENWKLYYIRIFGANNIAKFYKGLNKNVFFFREDWSLDSCFREDLKLRYMYNARVPRKYTLVEFCQH